MYTRHEVPVSSLRYVEQSILGVLNLSVDVELADAPNLPRKEYVNYVYSYSY